MICTDYQPAYDQAAAAGALTAERRRGSPTSTATAPTSTRTSSSASSTSSPRRAASEYARLLDEAIADGYDGWMEDFGEYTPLDSVSDPGGERLSGHLRPQPATRPSTTAPPTTRRARPTTRCPLPALGLDRRRAVRPGGLGRRPDDRASASTGCARPSPRRSRRAPRGSGSRARTSAASSRSAPTRLDPGAAHALGPARRGLAGDAHAGERRRGAGEGPPAGDRPRPDRQLAALHEAAHPALPVPDGGAAHLSALRPAADAPPGAGVPAATRAPPAAEDEFLLGPDLLVAPVLDPGVTERSLYLPGGRWVDLWRSAPTARAAAGWRCAAREGAARQRDGHRARAARRAAAAGPRRRRPRPAAAEGRHARRRLRQARQRPRHAWPSRATRCGCSRSRAGDTVVALQRGREAALERGATARGRSRSTADRRRTLPASQASLATLRDPFRPCAVDARRPRAARGKLELRPPGRAVLTGQLRPARAVTLAAIACARRPGTR